MTPETVTITAPEFQAHLPYLFESQSDDGSCRQRACDHNSQVR